MTDKYLGTPKEIITNIHGSECQTSDTNFTPSVLLTMGKSFKKRKQTGNLFAEDEHERRQERKERFQEDAARSHKQKKKKKKGKSHPPKETLVGRNKNLEKPYLRLTTFADPDDIRPLHILKKAFKMVQNNWKTTEDFEWCNEQLKSVRQDLKVQNIENDFAVEVYETHSRMLLENGDLNEFRICTAALAELHVSQTPTSRAEFRAYGILYGIVKDSKLELKRQLCQMPDHHCVRHALQVLRAVSFGNSVAFFKLYRDAPYMGAYLMDFLVVRVRVHAYRVILSAYRPSVEVAFFQERLEFEDEYETRQFLRKQHALIRGSEVDCKESLAKLR